jgi:two-component system, NtrC family, sensor histidine kinase HydH
MESTERTVRPIQPQLQEVASDDESRPLTSASTRFQREGRRPTHTGLKVATIVAFIVAVSCAHYFTSLHLHRVHAIYDRLYYLPIFMAALWFGLKGGVLAALGSSLLYGPHILFQWKLYPNTAPDRYLEILLFNIFGALTGLLAQWANQQRALYQRTSEQLQDAYEKLQEDGSKLLFLEQRLRVTEKNLALGELSSTVAHELMNPLGSIKGAAEILMDEFPRGHEKHAFLEILVKEIDRLERTTREILRFGTQMRLSKSLCNPNDLIDEVLLLTAQEMRRQDIKVKKKLASSVPTMSLDEDKIQQVFLNLILNAIQAMPAGGFLTIQSDWGPNPLCSDQQTQEQECLFVTISDTGMGIAEEDLELIFKPFHTTRAEGTGLGLAIVKRILEAHGGSMVVRSSPGVGTTFSIWLPGTN